MVLPLGIIKLMLRKTHFGSVVPSSFVIVSYAKLTLRNSIWRLKASICLGCSTSLMVFSAINILSIRSIEANPFAIL